MITQLFQPRCARAGVSLLGCALVLAAVSACGGDQSREAVAVREFHQRLSQNRTDLIYASSSEFLRGQLSEPQFRQFLAQTRTLGALLETERAHFTRTSVPGGPDLVVAFYNSRYAKAACLESFSWRVESGGLKLAQYSCAPNMQVTCPGGVAGAACETSPVPQPQIAGLQ